MKTLKINNFNFPAGLNLIYQARVADIGGQESKKGGEIAGTTGQAKSMQAIKISLPETLNNSNDLFYRAHTTNIGWLDWAQNGQESGSAELNLPMEALEIKLVPKGTAAPGRTYQPNITVPNSPTGGECIYIPIKDLMLYYYGSDSQLKLSTPVTTGTPNAESAIPTGVYRITRKSRNITLVGPTWRSFVNFWIPFIGQEYGLHNADGCRKNYGSNVYLTDGSYGCPNIPYQACATLFNTAQ